MSGLPPPTSAPPATNPPPATVTVVYPLQWVPLVQNPPFIPPDEEAVLEQQQQTPSP